LETYLIMAYSQKEIDTIFDLICERIENGERVRKILPSIHLSPKTFFKWVRDEEEKGKQYARALEIRADLKFDSIEDDYSEEPQRDPDTGKIDPAWVNLQRLKIDAKKWELAKMLPKKYGDKQETTHVFENPIFTGIELDVPKDNSAK
jgi:hypothetical protein